MKNIICAFLISIIAFTANAQQAITTSKSVISDTVISGITIPKVSNLQKKGIDKSKFIFNTENKQIEKWNGNEWQYSVLELCYPSPTND